MATTSTSLTPLACMVANSGEKLALIILNRPLAPDLACFKKLWNNAMLKAVTDGGANELYHSMAPEREAFLPTLITGDFDSIADDVMAYYKSKGVKTVHTPDQDDTDFTKCLKVLVEQFSDVQYDAVVAMGAFGGRLDQVFANLQTMYTAKDLVPAKPVYLVGDSSLALLLPEGKHVLHVDTGLEGDWCGIIPLGRPCNRITTTGLKWNLDSQSLEFGKLISTSNTWDGTGRVTMDTDTPVLWTMGYKV